MKLNPTMIKRYDFHTTLGIEESITFEEFVNTYAQINETIEESVNSFSIITENERQRFFKTFANASREKLEHFANEKSFTRELLQRFRKEVNRTKNFVRKNLGDSPSIIPDLSRVEMRIPMQAIDNRLNEDVDLGEIEEKEQEKKDRNPLFEMQQRMSNLNESRAHLFWNLWARATYQTYTQATMIDQIALDEYHKHFYKNYRDTLDEFATRSLISLESFEELDYSDPVHRVFERCIEAVNKIESLHNDPTITREARKEQVRDVYEQVQEYGNDNLIELSEKARETTKSELKRIMNDTGKEVVDEVSDEEEQNQEYAKALTKVHKDLEQKTTPDEPIGPEENPNDTVNDEGEGAEDEDDAEGDEGAEDEDDAGAEDESEEGDDSEDDADSEDSSDEEESDKKNTKKSDDDETNVNINVDVGNESDDEDQEATEESATAAQLARQNLDMDLVSLDIYANQTGLSEAVDRVTGLTSRLTGASPDEAASYANYIQRRFKRQSENWFAEEVQSDEEYRKRAEAIARARENDENRKFDSDEQREEFIKKMIKSMRDADQERDKQGKSEDVIHVQQYQLESAPPDSRIEQWIQDNKQRFRKRYGSRYKEVLYARAWKMYNKNRKSEDGSTSIPATPSGSQDDDQYVSSPRDIFKSMSARAFMNRQNQKTSLIEAVGAIVTRSAYQKNRENLKYWERISHEIGEDVDVLMLETLSSAAFLRTMEMMGLVNIEEHLSDIIEYSSEAV